MFRYLLLSIVALSFAACSQQRQPGPKSEGAGPGKIVLEVWDAANRADTAKYLSLIVRSRLDRYRADPAALNNTLEYWKRNKFAASIDTVRTDGDIANVRYHLHVTGPDSEDTTLIAQVYKEGTDWKYGY